MLDINIIAIDKMEFIPGNVKACVCSGWLNVNRQLMLDLAPKAVGYNPLDSARRVVLADVEDFDSVDVLTVETVVLYRHSNYAHPRPAYQVGSKILNVPEIKINIFLKY